MNRFSSQTSGALSSNPTIVADDKSDMLYRRDTQQTPELAPPYKRDTLQTSDDLLAPERRSGTPRFHEIVINGYGNGTDLTGQDSVVNPSLSSSTQCLPATSKLDGGEGGEPKGPPKPVGFWDQGLQQVRKNAAVSWLRTTTILSVFILAVLSIYWGVLYHVEWRFSSLHVYVVDFDGQMAPYDNINPLVGPAIVRATERELPRRTPSVGFKTMPASAFDYNPMEVRQAIYDFGAWAAIIINANATSLLQSSLLDGGNASYDPFGCAQTIFVEARDEPTIREYVYPSLMEFQTKVIAEFGTQWARQALSNSSTPRSNFEKVPQALNPAIGFSIYNLRPFGPATANPAVSIGLIYLIIVAFFSFAFFMPIHMEYMNSKNHPPLHFYQLIIWRWISTVSAYFVMSLCYSLVPLAFQIPFSNGPAVQTEVATNANAYGAATFPVYWMLNFFGMVALGLACENVAMIVGTPWTAMWLIFWVITNVCTSFYTLDLAPEFYSWGYAWPLHNIVEASRQLLFDLHSRIWLNFFVLFAWCVVNTTLFPFCCFFMRRKAMRARAKLPPREGWTRKLSRYVSSHMKSPSWSPGSIRR